MLRMEPHETDSRSLGWRAMAQNKRLLAAWKSGVQLGFAWFAFADNWNRKRYEERKREGNGSHLWIQRGLETDLIARLEDGQLQAYGIEEGSDTGPIRLAEYYFSKTAEVNYDNDTVTALGKKFHEVTVQGDREPREETPPSEPEPGPYIIDPREIAAQRARERLLDTPSNAPIMSREPHEITDQGEREPPHETLPRERPPSRESLFQGELESAHETPPSDQAPPHKPRMGRPPLVPKICEVVRELIDRNEFTNLSKKEIETLIRRRAKERFPTSFPKPGQPSKNKINQSLSLEGWPPVPPK
jgi:hypothetical protein